MDHQVVSSVWEYESKYDLYIDKFLELLLKYGYIWCEQDEKDFRTNLSNDEKRLFADEFQAFQKGLTSFDIAIQVKNIRKLYKKELLDLKKSGKGENGSILPWFSKARSLFSDKTDKENEISKPENISALSEKPPVTNSDTNLANLNGKFRNSNALPPKSLPPSSKTTTAKQTPIRNSISTTTTFSFLHNVNSSLAEAGPHTVLTSMKPTKDFKGAKPVLKAAKCLSNKSYSGTNSTISICSSPFEMTTTSSKIRHPFSPPTSISPASRIPMRRSITSSTVGASVRPTTTTSSTAGANVRPTNSSISVAHVQPTTSNIVATLPRLTTSSTVGAPVRHITVPSIVRAIVRPSTSTTVGVPLRPTTSPTIKAPVFPTTSSSTVGANVCTAFSVGVPVRTTTSSPFGTSVRPTSSIVGASKRSTTALSVTRSLSSPVAKYSSDRPTHSSATKSSRIRISLSKTAPSRVEVPLPQIATPCQTRVPRPAATIVSKSKGPIIMNAQSSSVGLALKPHNPATSCRRRAPVSLGVSYSRTKIPPSKIAQSPSSGINKPTRSSSSSSVSGISTPTYATSNSSILTPAYPAISSSFSPQTDHSSNSGFSAPAYPSSSSGFSPPAYLSSSSGVAPPAYLSSSSAVAPPAYPSSSSGVSPPAYRSSSSGVSPPAYPSSSGVSPPAYNYSSRGVSPPAYKSSSSILSPPAYLSSGVVDYTSAGSSSSTVDFTSTTSSTSANVLATPPLPSRKDVLAPDSSSSKNEFPLSYRYTPPYRLAVPISAVSPSSSAEVSFSMSSASPRTDVFNLGTSFSSNGLPLSPMTPFRKSRLPLSKTASCPNTGVHPYTTFATSPPLPQISPLKYSFSP